MLLAKRGHTDKCTQAHVRTDSKSRTQTQNYKTTNDGSANSLNRVQVIHDWLQRVAVGESCKSQNGEEEEAQT